MRRGLSQRFSIETPDPSVSAVFEQAAARVGAPRESADSPAGSAWVALAAFAMGDHEAGREAVRRLGDLPPRAGSITDRNAADASGSGPAADALALYLLLAARAFAWTGDYGFILEEWARVDRVLEHADFLDGTAVDTGVSSTAVRAAALRELAAAAQEIGRPGDAATLVRAARERAASDAGLDPGLALALGASVRPGVSAEWLSGFVRSSAEGAVDSNGRTEAAVFTVALIHGVLGAEPDAARQRLALRPCLPDDWTSLRIANLHVGDAVIALRHNTDGARRTFTFEQVAGAVPLRLAFEPVLPSSALRAAEVDGATARLDTRAVHDRIVAPVQLILDHERTVSFEC